MSIQAATVQVELSNRDDLVMKFMDAHGIDAPETIQLGLALGLDDPESTYVPSKPLPNDGSPEPKNGSTTMTEEKELNAVPKTQTGDTPAPSEPATAPAAPVVTAVGLSAEDKALIAKLSEDNKALEARLASIEKAGSEEKERRLSGARARVADLIGEDEDVALDGMDEAQLAFLEKTLKGAAARPAVLPMAGMSVPVTSQFAEKQKEAAAWHESVRFGKEKN